MKKKRGKKGGEGQGFQKKNRRRLGGEEGVVKREGT